MRRVLVCAVMLASLCVVAVLGGCRYKTYNLSGGPPGNYVPYVCEPVVCEPDPGWYTQRTYCPPSWYRAPQFQVYLEEARYDHTHHGHGYRSW